MAGYIPSAEGNMVTWLKNYNSIIPTVGPELGMTTEEVTGQQTESQQLIDEIGQANSAIATQKAVVATKNATKKTSLFRIRANVAHLKTNKNWTDAYGKKLQTDRPSDGIDIATYKSIVTLKVVGGRVQITFTKKGIEGINIYTRLHGGSTFVFLGHASHSPYTDARILATPGVAEIREYQVMGELNDTEIGQSSDIASITFS